ncbi:MAG: FecR domain-containing protein [Bacteroidales bacterium]|jgi:ferric-dicitrate binding protein FerR (iron transport regulator)
MENNQTYYTDLLAKYFSGEANTEEMLLLSDWLNSDVNNKKTFEEYQKTWFAIEKNKIETKLDVEDEWLKVKSKISKETKEETPVYRLAPVEAQSKNIFVKVLRIAAVILLLCVSTYFIYNYLNKPKYETLIAQVETIKNKLPDGSEITLNANSTIEYPKKFAGNKRVIKLKGEAYFNVTHDKTKPFIVSTDDINIEVLGTSFYVNTNGANGKVEVVLTEGRVAIYYKNNISEKIILASGEKAEISKTEETITKSVNNDENYMAFKTKKIIFNNTSLKELVKTLNKVYHSDIIIKNNKLSDCTVNVSFDNQSLESVLNVLKSTLDIKIKTNGSKIEINGNGCK